MTREDFVELGRRRFKACRHGPNTWCSCKVGEFYDALLAAGMTFGGEPTAKPHALDDHLPDPVPVPANLGVSLCRACGEKVMRAGPGGWDHFGAGMAYETVELS